MSLAPTARAWMINARGVGPDVFERRPDRFHLPLREQRCLVEIVWRMRIAALAKDMHGHRSQLRSECDHEGEALAAQRVSTLCPYSL